ncbi:MAG: tetratricopeptide repeat protein, partial [Anaerolineae bacterium]
FLDNLQWADESTFQLLGFLVRRIAPAGTLFVGAFRPEDTLADHPLVRLERTLSREGLLARMELSALSESDVVTMVISQTERDARTEELARWLYRESEGNPFFITEMVQALLDGGLLRQGPQGTWRLSPGLMARIGAGIPIPQTIRDVILSRIHELEPETRDVLALAAVLGRHFRYNVLRQASGLPEARLLDCLRAMLDRRLIREQETGRYEFTHDKIQQTVYDVTPEAFRAYRHRQAGTALEHLYAENPTPVIGELARHFRRGGEEQKAFTYLVQAGDRAWALYAHQEAIRHYQRAVDLGWRLPQVSPATLAAVHEKMSDVESLIGDYSAAMSSCERALDLAGDAAVPLTSAVLWRKVGRLRERQGDYEGALQDFERASRALPPGRSPTARLEHARLGRERAWVYMRQGHYDQARRRLRAAIDMIESDPGSEARRALGRLWTVLGIVDWYQSDYAAAAAELEQGLRIKEAIADDYGIGQSYNNLGLVYRSLGFYEKSLSYHNRGLALLRKIGDVAGQASCLHNIGLVHHNRGDYQAAIDCYQQSRELFEQIGFTTGLPAVYNDLGEAYLGLGDEQQALRDLEKGLRIAEEAGSRIALSALHSALAAARRRMGEHPPALEHARQALHLAEETDVGYDRAVAHRILGEVLATTQPDEARAHLQRSLQIAESLGERTELARSRRAYGQFLCAQGDRRGVRYLQQARDLFAELGARAEMEKTEALLKNVEHDR